MPDRPARRTAVLLWLSAFACLGLVLLAIGFIIWVYNKEFRKCVQLHNGLNIGYEAVFDLSGPYWMPIAVFKSRDGTPLVVGDVTPIFLTNTTLYGVAYIGRSNGFGFAWRADTGFVRARDDMKTYETLVAEAGDLKLKLPTNNVNTLWLLDELLGRAEYTGHRCRTWLVTW